MALFTGRQTQNNNPSILPATDLIAKCITEDMLMRIIANYVGWSIGQLKFEMYPEHFYNSNNIDTPDYACNFKDGWIYPNGTYITKQIFPEMYEKLMELTYPLDGKSKTFISNGKNYIKLPNIQSYFHPDNLATTHKSIVHTNPHYYVPLHHHTISPDGDHTKITIKDAAWIWSTKTDGTGQMVESRLWGSKTIPKTCTAHSGKHPDGTKSAHKLSWDMPINATTGTPRTIVSEGSDPIPTNGSKLYLDSSDICPKNVVFSVLMFAGIPYYSH